MEFKRLHTQKAQVKVKQNNVDVEIKLLHIENHLNLTVLGKRDLLWYTGTSDQTPIKAITEVKVDSQTVTETTAKVKYLVPIKRLAIHCLCNSCKDRDYIPRYLKMGTSLCLNWAQKWHFRSIHITETCIK